MKKTKIKKIGMAMAMLATVLCISAIPARAKTSEYYFNLKVNTSDISLRTLKDGGSDFEQRFYVTPTYFNNNVRYHAASFLLDTHSQYGVDIALSPSGVNKTVNGSYYKYASANKYYYLVGTYDAADRKSVV